MDWSHSWVVWSEIKAFSQFVAESSLLFPVFVQPWRISLLMLSFIHRNISPHENLNFSELWILVESLCWCVCMLLFLFHFMEPNREISRPSFITDSFHISSLCKCENNSTVKLNLICFRDKMLLLFWKLSVMIYLVTQKLNVLILDVFL